MDIEATVAKCMESAEIQLICTPDDLQIEGNCSAIDEETDRECEDWIRDQLYSGNQWAWCCVEVKASWGEIERSDYLGACSYKSKRDFVENSGYYEDMVAEAKEQLAKALTEHFQKIPA